MADLNKSRFQERLRTIEKKHQPCHRVEQKVSDDGLMVEVITPERRRLIPYKSILVAVALFVMLKGFLFAELGEAEYLNRIAALQKGQTIEVAAAFLLDVDPATRAIGAFLSNTLP